MTVRLLGGMVKGGVTHCLLDKSVNFILNVPILTTAT